ncbi:MAG: Plug domain-containing protein, partial [Gemmatimonadetes bacterium]|nr:Plug domain-containing protein [Gemmatimonadota bacterium]
MTRREAVLRSLRQLRRGFLVLALWGVWPATTLEAQDPVPADSVISLGELIVSALRAPMSVGEIPANVTTVTREELRLSAAQTLQDVLQEVPGLNFRFPFQAGVAHPSWQAVTLRGLGGTAASRTLVLVDGVPLNDPYFGWVRWSQVPVEVIERIEIVRGGATVSWGSQSLAGVVHVITRSG